MLVEQTTTPAAALPVADFRDHLRLGTGFADEGAEDSLLETFLRAAIAAVEAWTGKVLLERDFSWSLMAWRDGRAQTLPVAPVSEIIAMASRIAGIDISPSMTRMITASMIRM